METMTLAQSAGDQPIPKGEDSQTLLRAAERMSDERFDSYLEES